MTGIAVISPGAMGTAIGRALARRGHEIFCHVSQRSVATQNRAAAEGFERCGSLEEAIRKSDIAFSLVPPAQAMGVARRFASCVVGDRSTPIFVDGNSVSPRTAELICEIVTGSGARAVDCSIFGPADELGTRNVIVVSGDDAKAIAALFSDTVEVRIAGGGFGAASAVKMSMSIITKSLPALFLEATCASAASGQLDVMVSLFDRLYPGIMSFIRRSLPTYPQHVSRRIDEMREVEIWLQDLRQIAAMTRSARQTLERFREANLSSEHVWELAPLLEAIAEHRILARRQEEVKALY